MQIGYDYALQMLQVDQEVEKLKDCTGIGTKGDITKGKTFDKAKIVMKNFQTIM